MIFKKCLDPVFFSSGELLVQTGIPREGCNGLLLKNAQFFVSCLHLMRYTTSLHVM